MKRLLQLFFMLLVVSTGYAQYQPSYGQLMKPVGVNIAAPTDSRSYFYSTSGFNYTPFTSKAQVLAWFTNATRRFGNFPIYIQEGSKINQYRFKNGTTDADLVRTDVKVDSVVYNATSRVMTIYLDDNTTVTTSLPDYALKTDSTQLKVDGVWLQMFHLDSGIDSLGFRMEETGVAAGNYVNPSLTVDKYGRITLIQNGTGGGGSGSVTSVGLLMPSGFTVSNSPVTSSGNLTVTTSLNGVLKGNGSGFTAVSQLGNADISDLAWSKITGAPQPTQSSVLYASDSTYTVTNSTSYVTVSDTFSIPANYFERANRLKLTVYGNFTYTADSDSTGGGTDTLAFKVGSKMFQAISRNSERRIPHFKLDFDLFRKGNNLIGFVTGSGKYYGTKDPIEEFKEELQVESGYTFSDAINVVLQYKQASTDQDRDVVVSYFGAETATTSTRNNPGTAPIITTNVGSLSGFSTNAGTASTYQTFTVSGNNLTEDVTVTPPSGYEVSKSSSSGYGSTVVLDVESGDPVGEPVTVYIRLTSAASEGSYSGNVAISSDGAATINIAVSGTVASIAPVISPSTSTLSGFTATEGSYSASQNFTVTATNLTTDVTVTAPTDFQVSKDNTTWNTSVTLTRDGTTLSGEPVTVYVRIDNTAEEGSVSGNLTLSATGATSKTVALSGTVDESSGLYQDSAVFIFTKTFTSVSGGINVAGDPGLAVRTATGPYGIGVSSVATDRWVEPVGGSTASDNGGEASALTPTYWFRQKAPQASNMYNLEINGLVPGATYDLEIFASRLASAVGTAARYCSFICTDAGGDQTYSDYDVKGNISNLATFTSKVADSNGKIYLTCNARTPTDGSHSYAYLGRLKIKRTPR